MNHSYGTTNGHDELDNGVYASPYGAGMHGISDMHHQAHLQYGHGHGHRMNGGYGQQTDDHDVHNREPAEGSNDVEYGDEDDDVNVDDGEYCERIGGIPGSTGGNRAARAQQTKSISPNAAPSSAILQYLAQETRLFHEHLQAACEQYDETKKLPESLFGVKKIRALQKRSGKKATAGMPRKPTTFNMYIKKRIEEIRAAEPKGQSSGTEVFKRVVEEWRRLSPEEKKAYGKELLPVEGDGEEKEDNADGGDGRDAGQEVEAAGGKRAAFRRKPA